MTKVKFKSLYLNFLNTINKGGQLAAFIYGMEEFLTELFF